MKLKNQNLKQLVCLTVLALATAFAQAGTLTGIVMDGQGKPVSGATVALSGTKLTTTTDNKGAYTFASVPAGAYTESVTTGEGTIHRSVTVAATGSTSQNVAVGSASSNAMSTIVVTANGAPLSAQQAIAEEHDSDKLVSVLSQEKIQESGASNIADAAVELPGVSAFHDQGEARSIQIRGVTQKYNSVTFDGFELPSSSDISDSGRGVSLDNWGSNLVGGLILNKVNSPDQSADGLGGSVDLVMDSAFNHVNAGSNPVPATLDDVKDMKSSAAAAANTSGDNHYFLADIGAGYNSLRTTPLAHGSATYSDVFNLSRDVQLGVMVTGLMDYKHTDIDDLEMDTPNILNQTSAAEQIDPQFAGNEYTMRYYTSDRERGDFGANIELKVDNDTHAYVRGYFTGYDENTTRNLLDLSTTTDTQTGPQRQDFKFRYYRYEFRDGGVFLGADHKFDNGIVIDAKAGFATTQYYQPFFINAKFHGPTTTVTTNGYGDGGQPTFSIPSTVEDPSQYTLHSLTDDSINNGTQSWYGRSGIKIPVSVADTDGVIKTGVDFRATTNLYNDSYSANYDNFSNPISLTSVSGAGTSYYNNNYSLPALVNGGSLNSALANYNGTYTNELGNSALLGAQSFFKVNEDVAAGYAQYSTKIDRLSILGGLRFEGTLEHIENNETQNDGNGNLTEAHRQVFDNNYCNLLPSVQLKYDILPTLDARLSYAKSIARPDFVEMAANNNPDYGNNIPVSIIGNPNLAPARSHNFDASINWYPNPATKLEVGAFDKEISDYSIAKYDQVAQTQTFSTINHSRIYGVEGNYEEQFTFLPGFLSGFGVDGNVVLSSSLGQDHPGQASTALPGQCPLVWNLGGFYRTKKWTASIDANYQDAYVEQTHVGYSPSTDQYAGSYLTLNAKVQYAIDDNFKVYLQGMNLTDVALTYYEGSSNIVVQREFYGPSAEAGLIVTF